ncbi:hypothetical protein ACN27G_29690 [Plantactinospora sp. WMMB334]|uniref:hypothetical protein n=1 Tax=Plantactinospora sp. WMMB334 TaxID=3404119 RepID=UPI003B963C41
MRETLFRAAQPTGTTASEELVGQFQDPDLTAACWTSSLAPLPVSAVAGGADPVLILWPYPAATADCIDRANCADHFVRAHPTYHVLTQHSLADPAAAALLKHTNVVVFLPFEQAVADLSVEAGELLFRGRRCDAVMSEMTPGYLWRHGLLDLDPQDPRWPVRTPLVNGSLIAAHKAIQAEHFAKYCRGHDDLVALDHHRATTAEELAGALEQVLAEHHSAVIRPFSASQGTGVTFTARTKTRQQGTAAVADRILAEIGAALSRKYGGTDPFPVTVSPFVTAARIDGCVTDLRIFVVYDPASGGVRGLPGMVRRAQTPLLDEVPITAASAMTNLNAPPAGAALPGRRFFPATSPQIMAALGLTPDALVQLCQHAAAIWAHAFADDHEAIGGGAGPQFAYGSVDCVIREEDGKTVPIEMNGANVGSHPTVHPRWCDTFGAATTHALTNLGLAR